MPDIQGVFLSQGVIITGCVIGFLVCLALLILSFSKIMKGQKWNAQNIMSSIRNANAKAKDDELILNSGLPVCQLSKTFSLGSEDGSGQSGFTLICSGKTTEQALSGIKTMLEWTEEHDAKNWQSEAPTEKEGKKTKQYMG